MRLGLNFATGDILLIQDADLELDPQEYGGAAGADPRGQLRDVVYGSRFLRSGQSRVSLRTRASATRALTGLTNLLFGARLTDMETAYKVFRREALDGIRCAASASTSSRSSPPSCCAPAGASSRCRLATIRGASTRARRSAGSTASTPCYVLLKCRFGR